MTLTVRRQTDNWLEAAALKIIRLLKDAWWGRLKALHCYYSLSLRGPMIAGTGSSSTGEIRYCWKIRMKMTVTSWLLRLSLQVWRFCSSCCCFNPNSASQLWIETIMLRASSHTTRAVVISLHWLKVLALSPWTTGSTVRRMASTRPSGQPSRKQSVTSKSKRPGLITRQVLLPPRTSAGSLDRLRSRTATFLHCKVTKITFWPTLVLKIKCK